MFPNKMFTNKTILIRNQLSNVSLQVVRNFIPKNFLNGLLPPGANEVSETENPRELKKWKKDITIDESDFTAQLKRTEPNKTFPFYMGRGSFSPAEDFQLLKENLEMKIIDRDQKFIPERHQTLGSDLAVAHIVAYREGKIRQVGCDKFISSNESHELPGVYTPDWFLEEIDWSNVPISYKGLVNLKGLRFLKRATFKNCKYFDNWCLERIIAFCPSIEYLDVSGCKNINQHGLECLYKAWNLKEFTVTDWYGSPEFELTCILVEDCKPGLTINRIVISPEDRPSDLGDPYVPSTAEKLVIKLEKFIDSKRPVEQQPQQQQQQ